MKAVRPHRKAFTLIELLVVISIIALLIAILLPALGAARHTARAIQCGSQVRQLGLMIEIHANDNRGTYIRARTHRSDASMPSYWPQGPLGVDVAWDNYLVIKGYLQSSLEGSLRVCTEAEPPIGGPNVIGGHETLFQARRHYGIARNGIGRMTPVWGNRFNEPNLRVDEVHSPSESLAVGDSEPPRYRSEGNAAHGQTATDTIHSISPGSGIPAMRHHEGGNYAFLDGHVKRRPLRELSSVLGDTPDPSTQRWWEYPELGWWE